MKSAKDVLIEMIVAFKEYIEERMKQMTESEKICTKSLLERKYNMTFEIINYQYIKKVK